MMNSNRVQSFIAICGITMFLYSSLTYAIENSKLLKNSTAETLIQRIEGVYKKQFTIGTITDGDVNVEDILEIVPYENNKIYFVIRTWFYNGHSCDVRGIAEYNDGKFTFTPSENQKCKLNLSLKNDRVIAIEDVDHECRSIYCGLRGGLNDDETFTLNRKRKIRYMERILNSHQFKSAVEDYKKLKSPLKK